MAIPFSVGSGVNDSIFGKSQYPVKFIMEKNAEAFEQQSLLPELFAMDISNSFGEKYTTMTAMNGFLPVGENGDYPNDGMQEGYSRMIEPDTWKDQFTISKEAVDDAKVMRLGQKPEQFVTGYYKTRERFGAALYATAMSGKATFNFGKKAFSTLGADGKCVFATDHPSILKKKAQSNMFSDEFSAEALSAVESAMHDYRGDNGELLAVAPMTIVIPNDYRMIMRVFEVIGADKVPDSANNGFNVQYGRWHVIINPYFNEFLAAGIRPWMLLDQHYNQTNKGAVWLDREKLNIHSEIAGNDANVFKGRARFTAGFNDWRAFGLSGVPNGTNLVG